MDLLDVVIILLVIVAGVAGYHRGLSWVFFSLLGLILGLVLGTVVANLVAGHLTQSGKGSRGLIGFGVFASIVLLVQGIGTAIGFRARVFTLAKRRRGLVEIDSAAGAGAALLGSLIGAWFIGFVFANQPTLARQIHDSRIEQVLLKDFPTLPDFLAPLQKILSGTEFPNPFTGLNRGNVGRAPLPADVNTPGIAGAATSTVRVLSLGCGVEAGSAWAAGGGYFVTNAHVVAGSERVTLQQADQGGDTRATVVLFDPNTDVAVLYAPGLEVPALQIATADPQAGDAAAVIGFPGGGPIDVQRAAVRGVEDARGYNIYNDQQVTRTIEVLNALVRPGNSGGPLVDRATGQVIGLVFAVSTLDSTEGYALAPSQIRADLDAARGRTSGTDTQHCA